MKFLFLFCSNSAIDPVAPHAFQRAIIEYSALSSSLVIGSKPVFQAQVNEHQYFFLETRDIASAIYPEIANDINLHFPDLNMIGLVNWHEGANAPSNIFCAHSTADITYGIFGATSGELLAATLSAMESERGSQDLSEFRTLFEASHWSGSAYGRAPSELLQIRAPVFDIEIGSSSDAWSNSKAQEILVKALGKIPEHCKGDRLRAIYMGGVHFEPSASEMIFQNVAIEHHLPNQWLVSGDYGVPGAEMKIVAAAKSCARAPQLIIYHAGLKSAYKECARRAAQLLSIPCLSHKQFRSEGISLQGG